jgi:hypothetical protein
MNLKYTISVAAVALGLAFAGPASATVWSGSVNVPESNTAATEGTVGQPDKTCHVPDLQVLSVSYDDVPGTLTATFTYYTDLNLYCGLYMEPSDGGLCGANLLDGLALAGAGPDIDAAVQISLVSAGSLLATPAEDAAGQCAPRPWKDSGSLLWDGGYGAGARYPSPAVLSADGHSMTFRVSLEGRNWRYVTPIGGGFTDFTPFYLTSPAPTPAPTPVPPVAPKPAPKQRPKPAPKMTRRRPTSRETTRISAANGLPARCQTIYVSTTDRGWAVSTTNSRCPQVQADGYSVLHYNRHWQIVTEGDEPGCKVPRSRHGQPAIPRRIWTGLENLRCQ